MDSVIKHKELDAPDRNFVRALLGFTQMNNPTDDQITLLHGCIARRLITFDSMRGTYRVGNVVGRSIQVKSDYFDSREGVTFSYSDSDSGFVGFAGWADNGNVEPILWGVIDWVKEVTGYDGSDKLLTDFVTTP
jgi:hypothetical protein